MTKILISIVALFFVNDVVLGQALIYQFDGQNDRDNLGTSVYAAGDVNRDGFADVIIGAPYTTVNGTYSGSAYVYSGVDGSLLYQWDGNVNSRLGIAVSAAGDINNDGFDDVIVGADYSDINGDNSGSAYIYSGADGSVLYQWNGQDAYDSFGASVATVGDMDGDGFNDFVIGAPSRRNNYHSASGSAYAYSGADGSLLYQWDGQHTYDNFGSAVSTAGDINGDGFADVIIGVQRTDHNGSDNGAAYIFSGVDGSVLYFWYGQNENDLFGASVAAVGDMNGDGFDDVIIGSPGTNVHGTNSGAAYIYSGADGSVLDQWHGQNAGIRFGSSVSAAGDVDADGFTDLIIGASLANNNGLYSGAAYVISGADSSLLYKLNGQNTYDSFGASVSAAGDVDGDGLDDVIIGAQNTHGNGLFRGSAYVHTGLLGDRPPIAVDDNVSTRYDSTLNIDVLSNDNDPNGDAISIISIGTPLHGSASFVNDQVIYTPDSGWSGTDSFAYVIGDTNNNTASANIIIDVTRPSYAITNFIAGQYALFQISEAPTNSLIIIGYSLTGAGPTNTSLGPVDMSHPIQALISLQSDHSGSAWFAPLIPAAAAGVTFYTQAKCGGYILSDSLAVVIQ